MRSIDLEVDVTEAAGLGEPPHWLSPSPSPTTSPVARSCASPSRVRATRGATSPRTCPGPDAGPRPTGTHGAGWIFVSVDHLGVGDSSQHDPERLTYTPVVAASQAAETEVRQKLAAGTLVDGLARSRIR